MYPNPFFVNESLSPMSKDPAIDHGGSRDEIGGLYID